MIPLDIVSVLAITFKINRIVFISPIQELAPHCLVRGRQILGGNEFSQTNLGP